MSQIKKGDYVIAHLDGTFRGKVVEVVREQTVTWSAQGPMSPESFSGNNIGFRSHRLA